MLTKHFVLFHIQKALHMLATRTFTDERGNLRKNGEEWLITFSDTEAHIPGIYEKVIEVYFWHLFSCPYSNDTSIGGFIIRS